MYSSNLSKLSALETAILPSLLSFCLPSIFLCSFSHTYIYVFMIYPSPHNPFASPYIFYLSLDHLVALSPTSYTTHINTHTPSISVLLFIPLFLLRFLSFSLSLYLYLSLSLSIYLSISVFLSLHLSSLFLSHYHLFIFIHIYISPIFSGQSRPDRSESTRLNSSHRR